MYNFKCIIFLIAFLLNLNEQCHAQIKIVNGDEAEPHSMPYMVSIQTTRNYIPVQCGGTLISKRMVLTAAKCLSGATEVSLKFGAHNLSEVESTQVEMTSNEFIVHSKYNESKNLNDIALIKLPKEIEETDYIKIVKLPTAGDMIKTFTDETGTVAGWGKSDDNVAGFSRVLRKMDVTIIGILTCEVSYLLQLKLSHMCTSGTMGSGICLGDTGGPLMVNDTQVGIASFGNPLACSAGFPSVYTRLTNFLLWIQLHMHF